MKESLKPRDPNDISALNMDDYDEEESRGVGKSTITTTFLLTSAVHSHGGFRKRQRPDLLPR